MHSKIIQITTNKAIELLNENTLYQDNFSQYDYCSEISNDTRQEVIKDLVNNVLPKGMFTFIAPDTLRYNGSIEEWEKEFVATIQQKAQEITVNNWSEWAGETYKLEKYLKNPLETSYQFYTGKYVEEPFAECSRDFMQMVKKLHKGDILYIGGVIDYHF